MEKLKNLGTILTGNTPTTSDINNYSSDDICFVKPSDISGNGLTRLSTSEFYISEYARKKARILPANSILVTCIGIVGKVALNSIECAFNQQINAIIPDKNKCVPEYLAYAIIKKSSQLRATANSAVVPIINKAQFSEIAIPVPPPEKQKQIVKVLEKIERMISLYEKQLCVLDDLIKARFVEMFGDPFSNPMGWERMTFKSASLRLSDGPFGSNLKSEHYSDTGIRVIRLGNIGVGRFIDEDRSFIPEAHYERLKKYTCRAGEIVIGTLGEPNLRACIIPDEVGVAVNKADCVHYIPKPELLDAQFVCQYINCPETLLLAQGMIHGQTRSRVSSGQIAEMPIFVPPIEYQKQFSAFVAQIDKSKFAVQKALDHSQMLFGSLVQQYFE